jgi:transaldolase/glucose-6-phosphate isomerase
MKNDQHVLKAGEYQTSVDERLKSWREMNFNRRLWEKDSTLWFSEPVPEITDRLGWLNLPETMHEQLEAVVSFAEEVKNDGIRHVVVLGMGGSSLAPEVFQSTFGNAPGYPELIILDSTHPDAVRAVEEKIDLRRTLFVVASKSGTTPEPLAFFIYFWKKMEETVDSPGRHFIAITDPGTPLVQLAQEKGFRRIFLAPSDLGGRYSALTVFGLVPAALIGADVHKLLDRVRVAAEGCACCVSEQKTPGFELGAALGELAKSGRDKVTFFVPSSLKSFPNWLEQLIAESTGKDGKGIVPVVGEPLADLKIYDNDRFFIYFNITGDEDQDLEKKIEGLEAMGHPIARINLAGNYDIGLEIFRWEVAVASAGSILGIHPFNQPDVESAKELARQAMKKERGEVGEVETISAEDQDWLTKALDDWLARAKEGDYVAIQAYLPSNEETTKLLQKIRMELLNRLHLATTVGYGPRFLHSTGQLHKGGPNNGLFLQIVDEPAEDVPVPEAEYTFGELIHAQALGDYQALKKRGRRVLRVDLKKDVAGGLSNISELLSAKH